MKEVLINQIVPVIIMGVVAILVSVIKNVGDVAIDIIAKKKEEIEQKIKVSGHEADLQIAKEIWNTVEEKFRITENVEALATTKADMFDALLLKKIPSLTKDELTDLRQAIAGEFNKGKQVITGVTQLQQANSQLAQENENLKATISQIQSTVNKNKSE